MKLVFVSNYINHHQIPVCNRLYQGCSGDFAFIQTEEMEKERLGMGWQRATDIPYLMLYYENPKECRRLIEEADVVIFGGTDDENYIMDRLEEGKFTIRYTERMYKSGQWKAISPRGLKKKWHDHTRFNSSPVYLLCSGAYVPSDFGIIRAYRDKMYQWGYFPETKEYDIEKLIAQKGIDGKLYILWAARFIDWKHPELPLKTAKYLKDAGIAFHMDIVGGGELDGAVKTLHRELELSDCVKLVGFLTPDEVRKRMEKADIYLLTSDRKEGWGAVCNEAMNSGCAVVADHMVGAVPYLIRNGENGFIYADGDEKMLFETVKKLSLDKNMRAEAGREAYLTIKNIWNPETAADNLLNLIGELKVDKDWGINSEAAGNWRGKFENLKTYPCKKAEIISEKKMKKIIFDNRL